LTEQVDGDPWHVLNAGVLQLEFPTARNGVQRYLANSVSYPPLRGSYINDRHSVRADYDNCPLVAISRKKELVRAAQSKLLPMEEVHRLSPLVDYRWPSGNQHRLPALRSYAREREYEFFWLTLTNSCCLPEGFWRSHPALLELDPKMRRTIALKQVRGVQVSNPDHYCRRVGIAMPTVQVQEVQDVNGVLIAPPKDKGRRADWPAIPDQVYPLSAEIEGPEEPDPDVAAGVAREDHQPADGRRNAPLALLFPSMPLLFPSTPPDYPRPQTLAGKITVSIGKPSTSDENWERWFSALTPPDAATAARWLRQRVVICAGAHQERDAVAEGNLASFALQ